MRLSSISLSGLLLASFFLWILPVSACGCGVLITSSDEGWAYGNDSAVRSFINLEDGIEKLIISLDIQKRPDDAFLVIPIPSKPEPVIADVLSETPRFEGYDVSERAGSNILKIRDGILSTQIYPILALNIYNSSKIIGMNGVDSVGLGNLAPPAGTGITVYQHLEKEGMVAEVLTAATSDALYNYLTEKGLQVEKDSIPIFRDYIRDDFSFVVAWISPTSSEVSAKGLFMSFPAEKMYYPLKPGSAYSGAGTERVLNIAGYVTPELFPDIKESSKVNYFYSKEGISFKDFYTSDSGFGFTRVVINVEPKKLSEDLFIKDKAPLRIVNAQLINFHPITYGLVLLILLGFISTWIVSYALGLKKIEPKTNTIGLAIANCLTLIGTIVGAIVFLRKKRLKFIVFSSLVFVILTLAVSFLMYLPYR